MTEHMYWMQWSRSAKLSMGLNCLSMMRRQASWVRQVMALMSAADLPMALSWWWIFSEASTAVWEWNSATLGWSAVETPPTGLLSSSRVAQLTGVGDLEEDILHDVAAVGALELKLVALEQHVIEAPGRGGQHGGDAGLALHHLERQVDGALAGIAGGPRLAGHGVGAVAVGSQALAVDPGLGDGVGNLPLAEAEHLGHDGGRGDLDQDDVVEADLVVRVEQGQAALDLVGLDHALEHVADREDAAAGQVAAGLVGAVDPVGDGQDGAQVVRGMAPFGGQPAVVEVEPPDHGADVERAVDWVQHKRGAGNLGAVGHDGAGDNGTEQLGALLEAEALKAAAQRVEEDPSSSSAMSLISGSYSREDEGMMGAPESLENEVEKLLREAGAQVEAAAKPGEAKRLAPMEAEQRPLAVRDWVRSLDADLRLRETVDIARQRGAKARGCSAREIGSGSPV
ncbi:hypothetical protein Trco_003592 [Trichoderma cornu-damae]|uniref:Uncharacterized protein n=1 Tax=Trichoderma cornu-damae TaxID=654480 RepID=A0A9P8TW49_9HYPO|nr:hypothetical protein Trco_003592 [Trichoderma cornu-damae]